ncbi:Ubiquitin carboxyl-terminal hydrolase 34, partial [Nowakowskiella sp. JEL0078]
MLLQHILSPRKEREDTVKSTIPKEIYGQLWIENMHFLMDKNVFDISYQNLLWSALQTIEKTGSNGLRALKLGTFYFVNFLSRSKERQNLKIWAEYLKSMFDEQIEGCVWFMDYLIVNDDILTDLLFSCYIEEVRDTFVSLVEFVFKTLRTRDQLEYGNTDDNVLDENTRIARFIKNLAIMSQVAYRYWRVFDQYFELVFKLSELGQLEKFWIKETGFLANMIDLYLGDLSVIRMKDRPRMGDKFTVPNFSNLIRAVKSVVVGCQIVDEPTESDNPNFPLSLGERELMLLFFGMKRTRNFAFFVKQIREKTALDATADLIVHCSTMSESRSEGFAVMILREMANSQYDSGGICLTLLCAFMSIDDELLSWRVEMTFNKMIE